MANYDSDYNVRLQTLAKLGGDVTKNYDSIYEIDLEILRLTEEGGGGGGSDVINDNIIALDKTWSSSKISAELDTKQDMIAPDELTTLPFNMYEFQSQGNIRLEDIPAEVPANLIGADGNVICTGGFTSYLVRKADTMNLPDTIQEGTYYYNSIPCDSSITGYNSIVYRVAASSNNTVSGQAYGFNDSISSTVALSLRKPMPDEAVEKYKSLLKTYDGKVICWNGIEDVVPSSKDVVEKTPFVLDANVPGYVGLKGNNIVNCSTTLKKGHFYKLTLKEFNMYGVSKVVESTGMCNTQTRHGWMICFDEIGDLIKTVEYAAALEAKLADYESRISALEGNTTVE